MENTDMTKYFESWSGYDIPFKPIREIPLERALTLKSYYIAKYRDGRLMSFEKILDGQSEWFDAYEYWENSPKLKQRTMSKASGEITMQRFDKSGSMLD